MKLGTFSKDLTSEIDNLFSALGDKSLPEDSRLDQTVCIQDILERMKRQENDSTQQDPA